MLVNIELRGCEIDILVLVVIQVPNKEVLQEGVTQVLVSVFIFMANVLILGRDLVLHRLNRITIISLVPIEVVYESVTSVMYIIGLRVNRHVGVNLVVIMVIYLMNLPVIGIVLSSIKIFVGREEVL